jgi:hypothetical protein
MNVMPLEVFTLSSFRDGIIVVIGLIMKQEQIGV